MNELQELRSKYRSIIFYDAEVFETGHVFRVSTGKRINRIQYGKYECAPIRTGKHYSHRNVSRLVYQLFIDNDFNPRDNRYYIDTNGRKAGEYVLSEIKKVRALGTHKRMFTANESWGKGKEVS